MSEEGVKSPNETNENSVSALNSIIFKKQKNQAKHYFLILVKFIFFLQNESSSLESTKEVDFDTKIETDRSKRFDFLLKQTEIFSHFMTAANANAPKSPTKVKPGRKATTSKQQTSEKPVDVGE